MSKSKIELFFEQTSDAVFLLREGKLIEKNHAACQLMKDYIVVIKRIVEIAEGNGCILHSTKETCMDCELRGEVNPSAFLFILQQRKTGMEEQFSGSFTGIDQQYQSLVVRPVVETNRVQQIVQQKQLVKYVTEAHEKERKMIAQELHDGIAQSIFSLMLELRQVKVQSEQEPVIRQLEKMDEHFGEVLREIKQIAIDLRPMALDDLGLLPALKILLHRVEETTGMQVIFHAELPEELRLSDATGTVIYRVVQEALMNCAKYAGIQEVFVGLLFEERQLQVVILDHGAGFDLEHLDKTKQGLGLLNMQERAEMIGGHLVLESQLGEGTRIVLTLPLKEEERAIENHDS